MFRNLKQLIRKKCLSLAPNNLKLGLVCPFVPLHCSSDLFSLYCIYQLARHWKLKQSRSSWRILWEALIEDTAVSGLAEAGVVHRGPPAPTPRLPAGPQIWAAVPRTRWWGWWGLSSRQTAIPCIYTARPGGRHSFKDHSAECVCVMHHIRLENTAYIRKGTIK